MILIKDKEKSIRKFLNLADKHITVDGIYYTFPHVIQEIDGQFYIIEDSDFPIMIEQLGLEEV